MSQGQMQPDMRKKEDAKKTLSTQNDYSQPSPSRAQLMNKGAGELQYQVLLLHIWSAKVVKNRTTYCGVLRRVFERAFAAS